MTNLDSILKSRDLYANSMVMFFRSLYHFVLHSKVFTGEMIWILGFALKYFKNKQINKNNGIDEKISSKP